ncbi:hypothetical protein [Moorella sp. ACPs]|uniref:hypothetical protein n=1 Tax=Neomoorella carbonis TaxID=3062783 RepID=UPI00387352B3
MVKKEKAPFGGLPLSPFLATGILDSLSMVINISGDSYRLKEKRRAGIIRTLLKNKN